MSQQLDSREWSLFTGGHQRERGQTYVFSASMNVLEYHTLIYSWCKQIEGAKF